MTKVVQGGPWVSKRKDNRLNRSNWGKWDPSLRLIDPGFMLSRCSAQLSPENMHALILSNHHWSTHQPRETEGCSIRARSWQEETQGRGGDPSAIALQEVSHKNKKGGNYSITLEGLDSKAMDKYKRRMHSEILSQHWNLVFFLNFADVINWQYAMQSFSPLGHQLTALLFLFTSRKTLYSAHLVYLCFNTGQKLHQKGFLQLIRIITGGSLNGFRLHNGVQRSNPAHASSNQKSLLAAGCSLPFVKWIGGLSPSSSGQICKSLSQTESRCKEHKNHFVP